MSISRMLRETSRNVWYFLRIIFEPALFFADIALERWTSITVPNIYRGVRIILTGSISILKNVTRFVTDKYVPLKTTKRIYEVYVSFSQISRKSNLSFARAPIHSTNLWCTLDLKNLFAYSRLKDRAQEKERDAIKAPFGRTMSVSWEELTWTRKRTP